MSAPETWEDFLALCEDLKGQEVNPLANGIGSTPWMASGWFDYLNLRINGAAYHQELLSGEHAFSDEQVTAVLEEYAKLIPYFDSNMASYSHQEAVTPMAQNESAMYLVGAFVTQFFPEDQREDLDFFSVPPINPDVPTAEEAPTDGYFASSGSQNPAGAKALLSYLASPEAQQTFIEVSQSSNLPTSPDVDTSSFPPPGAEGHRAAEQHRGDHPVLQPRLLRCAADHRRRCPHPVPCRPVRHPGHPGGLAGRRRAGLGLRAVSAAAPALPAQRGPAARWWAGVRRVPVVVWRFLLLPVVVEAFWVFWPAMNSFSLSLTRWNGIGAAEPVGLQNYTDLAADPIFRTAVTNNLMWVIGFGGLSVIIGLTMAGLLNRPGRGMGLYRAAVYLPMVFSLTVTGMFWRVLYSPDGPVNASLGLLGLDNWRRQWLADPRMSRCMPCWWRRCGVRSATSWCSTWPG